MVEAHRAAVGLALAEGVPVRIDGDALDARRQRGDQRRAGRLVPGREGQQVRAHRARAEALDTVDAIAVQERDHAAVQRIERIAPEQVARHGRFQEVGMLLGRAIEQHRPPADGGNRIHTARCRLASRRTAPRTVDSWRRPAMRGRHRQPQQAALADRSRCGMAVALDGGGGQRLRQRFQRLGRRGGASARVRKRRPRRRRARPARFGSSAIITLEVGSGRPVGFQRSRRRSSARASASAPAQQRVEQDAQQHHVGLQELARVHGHVADAGLRRDGLGHDQHHHTRPSAKRRPTSMDGSAPGRITSRYRRQPLRP